MRRTTEPEGKLRHFRKPAAVLLALTFDCEVQRVVSMCHVVMLRLASGDAQRNKLTGRKQTARKRRRLAVRISEWLGRDGEMPSTKMHATADKASICTWLKWDSSAMTP